MSLECSRRHAATRTAARTLVVLLALVLLLSVIAPRTWSQPGDEQPGPVRRTVIGTELLGTVTFDTGHVFADTEVGGLSAITWDRISPSGSLSGQYYALSDDRSQRGPARFYTVSIDLSDGSLDDGDVRFDAVTTLRDVDGEPYAEGTIDPEGIALSATRTLFVSSEGNAGQLVAPWVRELSLQGEHVRELPLPEHYAPAESGDRGIRNNLAFEPLTITPDGGTLLTGTENALLQDGPTTDLETGSPSRMLSYDIESGQPGPEYVFQVSPVPKAPVPPATYADNGLVEHIALDDVGTMLSLERSYAVGPGNTVLLFETRVGSALDVSGRDALISPDSGKTYLIEEPAAKRFIADIEELGVKPDNLEGMALGPLLPDGRQSLILVSDNNFNPAQITQFIALALEIEAIPVAPPVAESPAIIDVDAADVPEPALPGEATDIALYFDLHDPGPTRLLATMESGGVLLMDAEGHPIATAATQHQDGRYTAIDVMLDFELHDGTTTDVAVVADNARNTIDVFAITEDSLEPLTSESMPTPILPGSEGPGAAYGVATCTSMFSHKRFAFVTQEGGNRVAQIELTPESDGRVSGEVVRTVALPVWHGDRSGGTAFGIAVGPHSSRVFVAFENAPAIAAFGAEPDATDEPETVIANEELLQPPLGGLTIHDYGADAPTLMVAHRSDSSVAAFTFAEPHRFRGRIAIAGADDIDAAARPKGIAITGLMVDLTTFRSGLLAVSDASNVPQTVVEESGRLRNASTGFKLVPWRDDLLPPVEVEPTIYLPRVVRGE